MGMTMSIGSAVRAEQEGREPLSHLSMSDVATFRSSALCLSRQSRNLHCGSVTSAVRLLADSLAARAAAMPSLEHGIFVWKAQQMVALEPRKSLWPNPRPLMWRQQGL